LNGRLGGSRSRSERFGLEKSLTPDGIRAFVFLDSRQEDQILRTKRQNASTERNLLFIFNLRTVQP
jgi:hypothetical protein